VLTESPSVTNVFERLQSQAGSVDPGTLSSAGHAGPDSGPARHGRW
jgi:hypothetical protein